MPDDIKYRVPLGLCRHAVMKLDAFMADIHEIKEDEELSPEDRQILNRLPRYPGR